MEEVRLDRFPWSGWVRWLTRAAAPPATTTNYYRSTGYPTWSAPRCKAEALYDFRRHHRPNMYLVGDIVDGWVSGPSWRWSAAQTAVVEEIAAWHRRGTRVVSLPGNHNEFSAGLVRSLSAR